MIDIAKDFFKETIRRIKAIEIQGAENVARYSAKALAYYARNLDKRLPRKEFWKRIKNAERTLFNVRPTEPAVYNVLNFMLFNLSRKNPEEIVKTINEREKEAMEHFDNATKVIAEYGARKIMNGMVIYTHCHSSAVMAVLKRAKDLKKRFQVDVTETRPHLQGRKSAKELLHYGIPVKYFIDSAGRQAIKEADMMLIGADSVTSTGQVINKIGSEMFAEIAHLYDVPVYICTDSWKYDGESVFGYERNIEEGPTGVFWKGKPKKLEIHRDLFERIDPELISGIISELGIYPPEVFASEMKRNYEWIFKKRKA
ncbi:MAG: ribose 1,5-bisphosphate isomerase [Candidatus Woesearchaeota archaeon]|nr:ribose 1,5-bisphosphate isomerase [Candidatus Woesearchaeota archaeon]